VTLHDIQAHLVKNCGEKDPPCPVALIERIGFEMKKGYQETTLQLLVSPAFLLSSDLVPRNVKEVHLGQGHLMLSGQNKCCKFKSQEANPLNLKQDYKFEGMQCLAMKAVPWTKKH